MDLNDTMTDPERQAGINTISSSSSNSSLKDLKEKNVVIANTLNLSSPPSTTPSDDSKPSVIKDLTLPEQRGINDTSRQLRRTTCPCQVGNQC